MELLASQSKTQEALMAKNNELKAAITALRKDLTDKGLAVTELEGIYLMSYLGIQSTEYFLYCLADI